MPQYDNTTRYEDIEDPAFMERLEEVKGAAPASWSWVEQGGMSSVKNQVSSELLSTKQSNFSPQKQCGSCAAFATMAVIETCYWQQTGTMYDDLSEQHIVDCANGHYYYDNE